MHISRRKKLILRNTGFLSHGRTRYDASPFLAERSSLSWALTDCSWAGRCAVMRLVALDDDVSSNHSSSHDPNEECAVCLALLFRPVRTSCGHLFCSACWDQHAARSGDDSAEPPAPLCPLCRTEATVAPDLGLGLKLQQQHPAEWARREDSFRKQGAFPACGPPAIH